MTITDRERLMLIGALLSHPTTEGVRQACAIAVHVTLQESGAIRDDIGNVAPDIATAELFFRRTCEVRLDPSILAKFEVVLQDITRIVSNHLGFPISFLAFQPGPPRTRRSERDPLERPSHPGCLT